MVGIDETREFKPIRIGILIMSDTRTLETDTSGQWLAGAIEAAGHEVAGRKIITDDVAKIQAAITEWRDADDVDVVITSGGTGLTGRDVTPEAVMPMLDKIIDGFSAVFHRVSYDAIGLSTLQSRAFGGVAGTTFVFCLPGSNGAVKDGWNKVLKDQLDSRHRPCNFVELIPRLNEA